MFFFESLRIQAQISHTKLKNQSIYSKAYDHCNTMNKVNSPSRPKCECEPLLVVWCHCHFSFVLYLACAHELQAGVM